jgi:hypothetical protein
MSQPLTSSCFVKNDWTMRNNAANPTAVVTSVYIELAHGLSSRSLHRLSCASAMLCINGRAAVESIVGGAFSLAMGLYAVMLDRASAVTSAAMTL